MPTPDLTDDRVEDSGRTLHEELSRILASVGECLWSLRVSADGTLKRKHLSPEFEQLTGYPVEFFPVQEIVDEPWLQLIVPEDRQHVRAVYEKLASGPSARAICEYRFTRADGEIIWIRDNCVVTRYPSGAVQYDGIMADISASKRAAEDQRKLEERVQQTQKLESIGVLAGGIAHDFNNLLLVILGRANLAASSRNCPNDIREDLQEIETATQRASELCRKLLVYSGRAPYVTASIDLGELVREMQALLRLTISPGVRIETDFPEEIAPIDGDAAQLRQLVMNLITNAAESMREGPGRIRISIEERWRDEADLANTLTHESLPASKYVLLSVSDTGCGMTDETLSRIFDPFFTTKFTGRGLGLAAALGIVRGHHGAISVTSEVGVGTRSLVYLPALVKTPVELATDTAESAAWKTSGVVLHVDDDDAVLHVVSQMLEHFGVKVISVASGEEALKIMDSGDHDIRCVILDLMMPGLSGPDTLRAIRDRNQDLPVLIATGYGESETSELLGGLPATGMLAKPFSIKKLEEALRASLGE